MTSAPIYHLRVTWLPAPFVLFTLQCLYYGQRGLILLHIHSYLPRETTDPPSKINRSKATGKRTWPNLTSQISCTVSTISLDENPSYTALSYVWGENTDRKSILANGTTLRVTQNLFLALEQLTHSEQNQALWIDAICINQDEPDEKSWQVGLMRDIYQQATTVVIWLGPATPLSNVGMDTVEKIVRRYY